MLRLLSERKEAMKGWLPEAPVRMCRKFLHTSESPTKPEPTDGISLASVDFWTNALSRLMVLEQRTANNVRPINNCLKVLRTHILLPVGVLQAQILAAIPEVNRWNGDFGPLGFLDPASYAPYCSIMINTTLGCRFSVATVWSIKLS